MADGRSARQHGLNVPAAAAAFSGSSCGGGRLARSSPHLILGAAPRRPALLFARGHPRWTAMPAFRAAPGCACLQTAKVSHLLQVLRLAASPCALPGATTAPRGGAAAAAAPKVMTLKHILTTTLNAEFSAGSSAILRHVRRGRQQRRRRGGRRDRLPPAEAVAAAGSSLLASPGHGIRKPANQHLLPTRRLGSCSSSAVVRGAAARLRAPRRRRRRNICNHRRRAGD